MAGFRKKKEKEKKSSKIIKLIKDIYDRIVTNVRRSGGITSEFPITIGLHPWLTLNLYLYALVVDEHMVFIDQRKHMIGKEVRWWVLEKKKEKKKKEKEKSSKIY